MNESPPLLARWLEAATVVRRLNEHRSLDLTTE